MINENNLTFTDLIQSIQQFNSELTNKASRAVNVRLNLSNWCVGAYINEYELSGSDRAQYSVGHFHRNYFDSINYLKKKGIG